MTARLKYIRVFKEMKFKNLVYIDIYILLHKYILESGDSVVLVKGN